MEKKWHVLLGEDDKDQMLFFVEALKQTQLPFKCTWAQSGDQALKQLAYLTPDIIFLDLEMPGMDGFHCLEVMRSVSRLHDIPVIVYATELTASIEERAMALGATFCIGKPVNLQELVHSLKAFLGAGTEAGTEAAAG